MKVMKFGGSSLATASRVRHVIDIIMDAIGEGEKVIVVVSAFMGVTDALIKSAQIAKSGSRSYLNLFNEISCRHEDAVKELVKESELRSCILKNLNESLNKLANSLEGVYLLKELSLRTLDFVMSFGEVFSAYILVEAIKSCGGEAEFLDTRELIKTDDHFGQGRVYYEGSYQNIENYFSQKIPLQIATGFIASTFNNETTTLGRGGSDFTASLFGRALSLSVVEIWTDVTGVMTADPNKVKKAFPIKSMTYEEAMEMSYFGAKVLHPPTVHPLLQVKASIQIKNSFRPEEEGTTIAPSSKCPRRHKNGEYAITGISSIDAISLLRIQGGGMIGIAGIAQRIFASLARKDINVILITQASSEHSICIAVSPEQATEAKSEIEEEFSLEIYAHQIDEVYCEDNLSVVAVVGENMRRIPGIAGRLFAVLGKNGINIHAIAQGSSELNISFVLPKKDEVKALNILHDAFFFAGLKPLHLFVVGTGLIGTALLSQIEKQAKILREEYQVEMRIVGIANSKKMLFEEGGVHLGSWKTKLQTSSLATDLEKFIQEMKEKNLRNSVFVDCTASAEVAECYSLVLNESISVVTPNKRACSSADEKFRSIRKVAKQRGVNFLYETNVGAALPVIKTIDDIICSGDRILKVEAILSGTLSYLFNHLSKEKSFSQIVREACEKGYTEPDPSEDLNGEDVARKILILARECGYKFELEDVIVEPLLPPGYSDCPSKEDFLEKIAALDESFEKKRKRAEEQGKLLRYIATFERKTPQIKLQEVGEEHPFYSLAGTDNIIALTTMSYRESPLVVRGPGAGAEVTAAGVFADIMRISHEW